MFHRSHRFLHRGAAAPLVKWRPELLQLEDRLAPGQTGFGGAVSLSLFGPALSTWQLDELASTDGFTPSRPAATQSGAMAIVTDSAELAVTNMVAAPSKAATESATRAVANDMRPQLTSAVDLGAQAAQQASESVSIFDPRVTASAPSLDNGLSRPGDTRSTVVGPNVLGNTLDTCGTGGSLGKMQSETAISHSGSTVVMAWNDSRGFPGYCAGYQLTGWAFSTDRGRTFTQGPNLPGTNHWGDPWLATGTDGTLYLLDLRVVGGSLQGMHFMKGTPTGSGVNWTTPLIVGGSAGPDRESMGVDPNNGNIYLSFTRFSGGSGIWVFRSTDGGNSFQGPVSVTTSSSTQGSAVAVGPNGEVYVTWQTNSGTFHNPTGVAVARSLDFGQSFTSFGTVATNTGTFVSGTDRTPQFPQIAVDTSGGANNGNVYITYHSSHLGGGGNLHDSLMIKSTNGGANWSAPAKINDDGTSAAQWFPTIDVDSFGNVHSFFYDRRGQTGNNTNLYYARSTNGGTSWEPNVRVSSQTFVYSTAGADGSPYFGDYINADTQGKSAMVSYADGRLGTPDTYFTRVGNRD